MADDDRTVKVVFGWRRLTPPAFIGGAEITEASLAALCQTAGHRVSFVGSFENPRNSQESSRSWLQSALHLTGAPWFEMRDGLRYRYSGVECLAVKQSAVAETLRHELRDADVLFTSQEGCDELARLGTRTRIFSYVHSVSSVGLLSATIDVATLLAPSLFVQQRVHDVYGRSSQLFRTPMVIVDRRLEATFPATHVLFVNPVWEKGLSLVVEIARALPGVRFLFVEAWRACDVTGLPSNVTVVARSLHMADLYRGASALVVPSMIEDASPRVIGEASAYGVPVLGAPVGGIPELVGNPSLLISTSQREQWTARLRELLGSAIRRAELGSRQLTHAMSVYGEHGSDSLRRVGLLVD